MRNCCLHFRWTVRCISIHTQTKAKSRVMKNAACKWTWKCETELWPTVIYNAKLQVLSSHICNTMYTIPQMYCSIQMLLSQHGHFWRFSNAVMHIQIFNICILLQAPLIPVFRLYKLRVKYTVFQLLYSHKCVIIVWSQLHIIADKVLIQIQFQFHLLDICKHMNLWAGEAWRYCWERLFHLWPL